MSTTYRIELTLSYIDALTRTYKLPQNSNPNASTVKNKIASFNTAAATSSSDVARTFISENGMAPVGITEARIISETEEVIYSG